MPTVPVSDGKVTLSDGWLRFLVWVVADGTIVDESKYQPGTTKRRVQFKLSRPEKIEKLKELLTTIQVPFTEKPATMGGVNKLQPWYIRIYGDSGRRMFALLGGVKQFPEWFSLLDRRQLDLVIDAITETDGHRAWKKIHWTTTNRNDVEIIGRLCQKHDVGFKFSAKEHASGFKVDCKTQYRAILGDGYWSIATGNELAL